jgi:hypothetical protein
LKSASQEAFDASWLLRFLFAEHVVLYSTLTPVCSLLLPQQFGGARERKEEIGGGRYEG